MVRLRGGTRGYASRVIVGPSGRVHVFFGGAQNPYVYRFSDDHGATWTTRTVASTTPINATGDMAVDSNDQPHLVYPLGGTWGDTLTYAVWNGTSWTTAALDSGTALDDHPTVALGFAERPHVFAVAHVPDGVAGSSIRHIFYDGAAWVYENVESSGSAATYGAASDDYATVRSEVFTDDSAHVAYTRSGQTGVEFVRADCAPGATGKWTLTVEAGVTARNPLFVDDVANAPAVLADGLRAYQPNGSGTFVAPTPTLLGTTPDYTQQGQSLLVAYRSSGASTNGHLYFSRLTF